MLNLVCTILLIVPHILKGQENIKDGKITDSLQITCPEISCELHHFPKEHCKVQTFIMYHGVECPSCVEDICHGSQVVADSLIGDVTQVNINTVDNTNANTGKLQKKWNKPSYINRLGSIFGNNPSVESLRHSLEPRNERTGNNQQMQGHSLVPVNSKGMDTLQPKSHIKCPEIECHHHHQPKAHCMVDSYFIYHDEKCKGCIEDICLGSHIVDENLIGKNKSQDLSNPETLPLTNQGVGNKKTSGNWRSGNSQPSLIERHRHGSNGQTHQEPHHTNHHQEDRISGNWRSGHSQPLVSERHIQNRNGQINQEHLISNQGTRGRILSSDWRSRNPQPLVTERTVQNSNGQLDLPGNPFFSGGAHTNFRNKLLGVQSNEPVNSRQGFGKNSNPNSSVNIPASLPNGQNTKNNEESIVVVDQNQSTFTRKDRGIGRFRGKGRSYLQSLFHPAFTGHQFINNVKITGSLQITCPEISCELHHFPQEHCKVQTFFMYHGVSCQSCVEDICHGSQVVPASLIGNTSQVQNLQKTDNSNEVTPNQKQTWRVVNYINKLWTLFGNNRKVENLRKAFKSGYSRTRSNQRMQGYGIVPVYAKGINTLKPKLHIKCPEIECHHHHQPKAHCMVHSYFIYHGRKCNGCIEDICIGSHTVVDFLIGKNDSKYAPSPEKLPLRDQGIGNRVIAGEWKPGHSQLPLLENHKHSSNEQITQESHQEFTDRIYGNWRPGPSQPPLHVIHIQNINTKINPETIFPDKHQEARGRLFSGVWRSRNPQPIVVEIGVRKSKEQLEWSRNPNFNRIENNIRNIDSQWNHKNKNGVQTNAHINSRHNSGRNWNPNSSTKVQTTLQNKQTSKTNKEGNIGVEQKQSSLTRKDGAIWQIRAKGKSFLQSLFHPAFFS